MFTVFKKTNQKKNNYWKKNNRYCSSFQRFRRFRAPQVWSASLRATAANPFIHQWLEMQAMREECLVRASIICISIVQKGRFRDFTTAKQEAASPQVIMLNRQREAVISCDSKPKQYRTISVVSETKTCRHSVCHRRPLKNRLLQVPLRRFVQMLVLLLKKKKKKN